MSSRALKDRMMYGFDDDSVDAFSFSHFLFLGDRDPGFEFQGVGKTRRWEDLLLTRQADLLWSLGFAILFMSYFLSVQ